MSSKKISIDPKLFNMGSSNKTRSKRSVPAKIPAISPNVLKNKLLDRIKKHKSKEIESANTSKSDDKPKLVDSSLLDVDKYNNEFDDSMSFLQTLSTDTNRREKKAELQRKTVKHHSAVQSPYVNLELPEMLKEPPAVEGVSNFTLKSNISVPYGNLKNGSKPTYREWNKTQKYVPSILSPNPQVKLNERENRMKMLREKIKKKHIDDEYAAPVTPNTVTYAQSPLAYAQPSVASLPVASLPVASLLAPPLSKVDDLDIAIVPTPVGAPIVIPLPSANEMMSSQQQAPVAPLYVNQQFSNTEHLALAEQKPFPKVDDVKRSIKRTIRKRYTLGKSKIRKSVSVLLKDNKTRKNVIAAQKELKRQPINDVKQYLRDHNLIKVGSNAPNEIVRKIYETVMLAGDITNNNKDTLLHNFIKGEDQ